MGIKSTIANYIASSMDEKVLVKNLSDSTIRVENAMRSVKSKRVLSGEIKRGSDLFSPKTVKDWVNAIAIATDQENPDFLFLAELYKNLLLDAHVVSVIESRVMRVLRSKFLLLNQNGEDVPELKKLLERPWFEQFLKQALLSEFTGVKVLELFDLDESLELIKTTLIPIEHTKPNKGIIIKEPGDETGWDYKAGIFERYYIQIGEDNKLGMLADLAPLILAKKLSFGSWLDYIEKYGIPARYITTDNMTPERQDELYNMGMEMVSSHVCVLQGNEKIETGATPSTDTYKVFQEFIKTVNNEISKRVLGQTMTTENGSSKSQAEVHEKVANDRHESDKLFAQYIINKILFPKLVQISSIYAPLANHTFDWDESEQMSAETIIDKAVALTNAGFTLDYKIIGDRTSMPITGFTTPSTGVDPVKEPKTSTKKKSQ